jgi:hypothetical protein
MYWNCVYFIKIYLSIAPTCFGYCLAIIRVLVIWYTISVYIFQDTLIYISVLEFQITLC